MAGIRLRPARTDRPHAGDLNPVIYTLTGLRGGRIRLWGDDGVEPTRPGVVGLTSQHALKIRSGAGMHVLVRNSGDTANLLRIEDGVGVVLESGGLTLLERATRPSLPAAGYSTLYAGNDDHWRILSSAAVSSPIFDSSYFTAAGQLVFSTTANAFTILAVGTAFQELTVSTGATALAWASGVLARVTTAGDIVYATSANAITRLAIGTATQVVHGGATAPTYGPIVSADITANAITQRPAVVVAGSNETTTSTSTVVMAAPTKTLTTTGGDLFVFARATINCSTASIINMRARVDSGTWSFIADVSPPSSAGRQTFSGFELFSGLAATSHVVELGWETTAGTATVFGSSRRLLVFEVIK